MDVSAVKKPVDVGITVYGTQVNLSAQSIPGALLAKDDNKGGVVSQPIAVSINDKANKTVDKLAELHRITTAINQFVEATDTDTHIQFKIHEKTNELMVQVVDQKTDKVIREYPSQEFLDTIAAIRSYVGMLLDKRI